MKVATIRPHGVRIEGKWYWCEALYGRRHRVCFNKPEGSSVVLYDPRDLEQICTAQLVG